MAEPLSAKQLALHLKTDARTTRKFLRATFGLVGQGSRWSIEGTPKELKKLTKDFAAWQEKNATRAKPADAESKASEASEGDDEEINLEELDDHDDLDLDD